MGKKNYIQLSPFWYSCADFLHFKSLPITEREGDCRLCELQGEKEACC